MDVKPRLCVVVSDNDILDVLIESLHMYIWPLSHSLICFHLFVVLSVAFISLLLTFPLIFGWSEYVIDV